MTGRDPLIPFVADPDFALYVGDVRDVLSKLPDESVDCCVTSPPYWGLRDYGVEGQIGLEPTPEEYVARMVAVFAEVRRVLRPDGTCWLNIGDSYASSPPGNKGSGLEKWKSSGLHGAVTSERYAATLDASVSQKMNTVVGGLKPKDLVGIPWRVAFALQQDSWYLRSDIIWAKPNPMPESVTDRPTKSHEYLFLLTKSARYFYDADAIREPAEWARWGDQTNAKHEGSGSAAGWIGAETRANVRDKGNRKAFRGGGAYTGGKSFDNDTAEPVTVVQGSDYGNLTRNSRSVWEIATQPYAEAHFATFPEELPRRCIAAGCPEGGTVIDPFMGSGTTALVARKLGRNAIGVELNEQYAELCARRLSQLSLLAEAVGE